MFHRAFRWIAVPLLLLAADASAQDGKLLAPFQNRDFSRIRLTPAELKPLLKQDTDFDLEDHGEPFYLPRVRALIFGRHGRIFREVSLQEFLKAKKWYRPDPKFANSRLNVVERANLDLVREMEAKSHDRVKPGDLRFWRDRPLRIPESAYYQMTDLRIMQAEIEAIHGRVFKSQPMLQRYFEDRYWYRPDPKYAFAQLSKDERANLKTLRELERKAHDDEWFDVSDIAKYESTVIPKSRLEKLSLYELRVMRNALYASRGYRFKTPWLREYFESSEWYVPSDNPPKLTPTDNRNLQDILGVEQKRHDELSTKPVTKEVLRGLFVEDLRRLAEEIPARHGRVFKDASLRSYFESLTWYKPNPAFREAMLSKTERENLAFLRNAMKSTTRQFALEEG